MCKVSTHIKFCTCNSREFAKLDNYWIFHRYDKERDFMIIGEAMLPNWMDRDTIQFNKEKLLIRVNEADAFDTELLPKQHDRLQIHLSCGELSYDYGFRFSKGRWIEFEYDHLEWEWKHIKAGGGKTGQAFQ